MMYKKSTNIKLIFTLMIILAYAFTGEAFAQVADNTIVTGNIAAIISMTAPVDISNWGMSVGPNQQTGTLTINANTKSWYVRATDADTTNTNGKMSEWDTSTLQYITVASGGYQIGAAMTVGAVSIGGGIANGNTVTLPNAGGTNILTGGKSTQGDRTSTITFAQAVASSDTRLTDANRVYRIEVTFTAGMS